MTLEGAGSVPSGRDGAAPMTSSMSAEKSRESQKDCHFPEKDTSTRVSPGDGQQPHRKWAEFLPRLRGGLLGQAEGNPESGPGRHIR